MIDFCICKRSWSSTSMSIDCFRLEVSDKLKSLYRGEVINKLFKLLPNMKSIQ